MQVVAFIKGTRTQPQCGFSHRVLTLLKESRLPYEVVNVLDDVYNPGLREELKAFSQWPTIPQVPLQLPASVLPGALPIWLLSTVVHRTAVHACLSGLVQGVSSAGAAAWHGAHMRPCAGVPQWGVCGRSRYIGGDGRQRRAEVMPEHSEGSGASLGLVVVERT